MRPKFPVREVIFGLEDSLVSTLGVVVGIAVGTNDRYTVILSAIVVIVVESLSMSAGTYLSNKAEMEFTHVSRLGLMRHVLIDTLFMGIFYILGGILSIIPFFFFEPSQSILPAIIISISSLFVIGYIKGSVVGTNKFRSGLEMGLVSLSAAALGYLIGKFASPFISR